jgi:hypothetical protein
MKTTLLALTLTLTAGVGFAGQSRTFTGVISDSMCLQDHAAMKVEPDSKCVTACVYYPANEARDGRWLRITVRTIRPGVTLSTRGGYYAPTS